jgi:hypothetical protein
MSGLSAPVATVWTNLSELLPPVVATLLLALALAFAVGVIRWFGLRFRARSPRVQIAPFAWAAAGEDDREAAWITSLFREQLTDLRLDPLDPLPERAPGAPVVEIIEGVGNGIGQKYDLGAVLSRIYRAAFPDSAYEAWGTLRPLRSGGGRISVQLVDRARSSRTVVSFVSDRGSWEEGADQAAMAVAGGLYPRVARRYKGPWTRWQRDVPQELIGLYHEARQHEAANRLELALGAYLESLERDPLNPHLRLKIAMLQERLGLDLEAWVTYNAIVDEDERRAWRGPDRKARLVALFRLAVLLCNGRIAARWLTPDADGNEGRTLRKELVLALENDALVTDGTTTLGQLQERAPFARLLQGGPATALLYALPGWDGVADPSEWIAARFPTSSTAVEDEGEIPSDAEDRIKEVLEIVALRRLEELNAWLRAIPPFQRTRAWLVRRPPPGQWLRRRELSRAAVRLSKRLTRLRIAASAKSRVGRDPSLDAKNRADDLEAIHKARRRLTHGWPFPEAHFWTPLVRWLRPRLRWADRREDCWQLHYNAACAAASTVSPEDEGQDDYTEAAMRELEEYAHRAGSSRVAEQAEWVALEDPDLANLYRTAQFKLWANHHLPFELPEVRPQRKVDVDRVAAQMLQQGAAAFARSWQARAAVETVSPEAVATWWREETIAWRTLREVCEGGRSWRRRLDCMRALQACLAATDENEPIEFAHAFREHGQADGTRELRYVLEQIARLIGDDAGAQPQQIGPWARRRAETAQALHEDPTASALAWRTALTAERSEARLAARIWDALARSVAAELAGRSDGDFPAVVEELR